MRDDILVISSLVDAHSRNGALDRALGIIIEYERRNGKVTDPRNGMWMSLLNGCIQNGAMQMAKKVYAQMKDRFDRQSDYMQSAAILMRRCK